MNATPQGQFDRVADSLERLRESLGQEVTIWPREDLSIGMSRDTEPGLQPWKAKVLGYSIMPEGGTGLQVLVQQGEYEPRLVDFGLVRFR